MQTRSSYSINRNLKTPSVVKIFNFSCLLREFEMIFNLLHSMYRISNRKKSGNKKKCFSWCHSLIMSLTGLCNWNFTGRMHFNYYPTHTAHAPYITLYSLYMYRIHGQIRCSLNLQTPYSLCNATSDHRAIEMYGAAIGTIAQNGNNIDT